MRWLPALRGPSGITGQKAVQGDEAKSALTSYYSSPYATSYLADRFGGRSWSTETAVIDGYERVVWAFKAVNTIAFQQARLPFVYTDSDDKSGEIILDQPWSRILNVRANPLETGKQFRRRLSKLYFLSKHGVFIEVSRSRAGTPVRADIMAPDRTRPIPGKGADLISHYEYTDKFGSRHEIGVDRVVWVRDPHPLDPLLGSTPLEAAGLSVELDYHARRYNVTFLRNDGRPGMLIAVKGDLDDAEAQRLEMHFAPGPENAGRTTVVEADGIDAKDLGVNPRDMAYEKAADSAKNEVLVAFGTPESVLGNASGRTWDNADVEMGMFWEITMTSHLDVLAEPFTDEDPTLIPMFDTSGVDALNRPKRLQRQEAREEFQAGLRNIDSYLKLAGQEDMSDSTALTRAFHLPAGKMPIASSEADQEELGLVGAVDAPPGEAPPGALNPDDDERDVRDERTRSGFENELDEETEVDPETIGPPVGATIEGDKQLDLTAGGSVYSDFDRNQLEQAVATALQMWSTRHAEVWAARLRSPKMRRGTLLWEPEGEGDARLGTKEVDVDRVTDRKRWIDELTSTLTNILEPSAYDAARDLAADVGLMLTETPARQIAAQAVEAAMVGAIESATRWLEDANGFLRVGLSNATSHTDLEGIIESLQAFVRSRSSQWIVGLSSQVATSTVEAARSITANELEGDDRKKVVRQWTSRKDSDVRGAHAVADRQTRAIGEAFVVGGYEMQFPGDPTAPPSQTRNCRCRVVYRSSESGRFVPAR